ILTTSCLTCSKSAAAHGTVTPRRMSRHLMAQFLLPMIAALKVPQRLIALIIVIAATSLVYWPAQRNGFVWDDTALVLRDPLIRSWRLIPESFRHFLFLDATASNFYRPLQRLTFTGDYALHDRNARGRALPST